MRKMVIVLLVGLLHAGEIRGVWVDRPALVSRDEIRKTMRELAAANFNTVHVNVWSRGYPLWRSKVFEQETGLDGDPGLAGRDVLAEAVEEAAAAGLAVIPWFEYGFVGGWSGYFPGAGGKGPIFDRHPDWLARTRSGETAFPIAGGGGNHYWMIHAHPEVQRFLIALVSEVAANYNVPAVEFDRARYPQPDCGYDETTAALYARDHDGSSPPDNPADAEWIRWRTAQLNAFAARLRNEVRMADWRVLITNAPVPLPTSVANFAQDYSAWVRDGSVDFVSPQVYRRDAASFERDLDNQIRALPGGARLVPGIDVTNSGTEELVKMIQIVRARGLPGFVVWYHRGLLNRGALEALKESVMAEPAALPWRR